MRVSLIALCAVVLSNSTAYAYLGGFEPGDGYVDLFDALGGIYPQYDVAEYNAGKYATGLGPDTMYDPSPVAGTPYVPGLWTKTKGTLVNRVPVSGVDTIAYATGHSVSGDITPHNGSSQALAVTTEVLGWSGPSQQYAYALDKHDLGINPASSANTTVKLSFWSCSQIAGTGDFVPGIGSGGLGAGTIGNIVSFLDGPGVAAKLGLELGYIQPGTSTDYAAIHVGSAGWVDTGIEVDPRGWHRWDVTFDMASKRVAVDLFDPGPINLHTTPVNVVPWTPLIDTSMSTLEELRFESTPGINNSKRWALDDFTFCVTEAPLSVLLEGGTLWSGDKQFSEFEYHGGGDMPAAEDIFVKAITDADGNVGIRFQGAFVDAFGGGASDALIDFKVTAPEGKLIKDVHMAANPLVIGGSNKSGLVSVTETFLSDNDQTVLSVFDIAPGSRQLTDWADLVDENGNLAPVQELHVQKDILAWTQGLGSAATMSFIDQTFSQCDADPMNPGICSVGQPGSEMYPAPDFNGDGFVDAADYTVWRDGLGTKYTEDDFLIWREFYGQSVDSGASSASAIPEPASMFLMLTAFSLGLGVRRRCRRKRFPAIRPRLN